MTVQKKKKNNEAYKNKLFLKRAQPLASIKLPECRIDNKSKFNNVLDPQYRGGIDTIKAKGVSRSGRVVYNIQWKDGSLTSELSSCLTNHSEVIEQYEFDLFQKRDKMTMSKKPIASKISNINKKQDRKRKTIELSDTDDFMDSDTIKSKKRPPNRRPPVVVREESFKGVTTRNVSSNQNKELQSKELSQQKLNLSCRRKTPERHQYTASNINSNASPKHLDYLTLNDSMINLHIDNNNNKNNHANQSRSIFTTPPNNLLTKIIPYLKSISSSGKDHSSICHKCNFRGSPFTKNVEKLNTPEKVLLPCGYCTNSVHVGCLRKDFRTYFETVEENINDDNISFSKMDTDNATNKEKNPTLYYPPSSISPSSSTMDKKLNKDNNKDTNTEIDTNNRDGLQKKDQLNDMKIDKNSVASINNSDKKKKIVTIDNSDDKNKPMDVATDHIKTKEKKTFMRYVCNNCLNALKDGRTLDSSTLLFRCKVCLRAFNSQHMPALWEDSDSDSDYSNNDKEVDREERLNQKRKKMLEICNSKMTCATCLHFEGKEVETILTWRNVPDTSEPIQAKLPIVDSNEIKKKMNPNDAGQTNDDNDDLTTSIRFTDDVSQPKVFLIKWKDTSYRHLSWVPGSWLRHYNRQKMAYYIKKHIGRVANKISMVVPLAWKKVDRIFDQRKEPDGSTLIFAKYHGLPYDTACWDTLPFESELLSAYQVALERFKKIDIIKSNPTISSYINDIRNKLNPTDFGKLRENKAQPHYIQGGQLLGHQLEGLNWLLYQWERQQPCILADDMGLGKTIQIVVFLYVLFKKYNIYPFLLVVPNSTVMNWVREFSKWAPEMVVVPYQGSRQSREYARKFEIFKHSSNSTITSCHAVITTYESSLQDYTQFSNVKTWPYLIVDEAHRLKNKSSQLFQKLDQLKTDNRVLLTGTPLQNNIEELITIMNFIDSKKFQNITELGKYYSQLTHETIPELHSQLKPYFLRRTKETELTDLSPKKELIVPVSMTSLQKELYKATLMKNASIIAQLRKIAASSVGLAEPKKKLNNSNILMELRKILNHPYLIHGVELIQSDAKAMQQAMIDASAKLSLLHMILPKLKAKGHRVLIFSTMAIMLDILEDYLIFENLNYVRIDGSTNQETRVENIDRFNDPESSVFVFLLTTRAGGVGINLATADTVILFDSDFNPHADMQAICRAHRFGQKKPVLVLRLITRLSAEERILEKSKKKMIMDHLVVEKMDDETIELDDIENILKFGAQALFENDDSKDIVYDAAAVDDLLNRELQFADMMKENKKKNDNSDGIMGDQEKNGYKNQAQDQQKSGTSENNNISFSFAKIWQTHSKSNDTGNSQGNPSETDTHDELVLGTSTDEQRDNNIWEQLLEKNKQELAKQELEKEKLGRGARQRKAVSYAEITNIKKNNKKNKDKEGEKEFTGEGLIDDESNENEPIEDGDYMFVDEEEEDDYEADAIVVLDDDMMVSDSGQPKRFDQPGNKDDVSQGTIPTSTLSKEPLCPEQSINSDDVFQEITSRSRLSKQHENTDNDNSNKKGKKKKKVINPSLSISKKTQKSTLKSKKENQNAPQLNNPTENTLQTTTQTIQRIADSQTATTSSTTTPTTFTPTISVSDIHSSLPLVNRNHQENTIAQSYINNSYSAINQKNNPATSYNNHPSNLQQQNVSNIPNKLQNMHTHPLPKLIRYIHIPQQGQLEEHRQKLLKSLSELDQTFLQLQPDIQAGCSPVFYQKQESLIKEYIQYFQSYWIRVMEAQNQIQQQHQQQLSHLHSPQQAQPLNQQNQQGLQEQYMRQELYKEQERQRHYQEQIHSQSVYQQKLQEFEFQRQQYGNNPGPSIRPSSTSLDTQHQFHSMQLQNVGIYSPSQQTYVYSHNLQLYNPQSAQPLSQPQHSVQPPSQPHFIQSQQPQPQQNTQFPSQQNIQPQNL